MAPKKATPRTVYRKTKSPKRTLTKSGYISQTLRITAEENDLVHKAAAIVGLSINGWACETLRKAALAIIAKEEKKNGTP